MSIVLLTEFNIIQRKDTKKISKVCLWMTYYTSRMIEFGPGN